MSDLELFIVLLAGAPIAYFFAQRKAFSFANSGALAKLSALPRYYGYMVAIWTIFPALTIFTVWSIFETNIIVYLLAMRFEYLSGNAIPVSEIIDEIHLFAVNGLELSLIDKNLADKTIYEHISALYTHYSFYSKTLKISFSSAFALLGFSLSYAHIKAHYNARSHFERVVIYILSACALIAILVTFGIVFSVFFESIQFFSEVSLIEFLFGTHWSPQIAMHEGQTGSSGAFGAVPLFWGTLFISMIALLIAIPLGLFSAIYLSEYAGKRMRIYVKPILEILAGIPTVVYGFFAALTIGPMVRDFGYWLRGFGVNLDIEIFANLTVSSESALAAGLVMGMMIVPFVLSLSDDVISAVPESLRDASLAMGATRAETVWQVIVPAALPGIVGSFLLAASRAIGETMIVLMAAGVAANLSANPFDAVTTVTTQIVTLLTGDQAFDNVRTLAAFALGLGLFIITLLLNIIALQVVKKYREQYE